MTTPKIRRGGLLAVAALLLGACQWGLTITPETARKGQTVSVSNEGYEVCWAYDDEEELWAPGETDVVVIPFSSLVDFSSALLAAFEGGGSAALSEFALVEARTDEAGVFTAEVPVPSIPGDHLVMAICNATIADLDEPPEELPEDLVLQLQAAPGDVDPEAMILLLGLLASDDVSSELVTVGQDPFVVGVDKVQVTEGDPVVASFTWCQAENDFDLPSLLLAQSSPGEVDDEEVAQEIAEMVADLEEVASDFPSIDVYVDGELVQTIEADERYPTGVAELALTLTGVGDHEIEGRCRYQSFELDREGLAEMFGDLSPQAVEYPYTPEVGDEAGTVLPFTWDEVEVASAAAARVEVLAAAGAGTVTPPAAQPVVAAPSYTG